MFSRDEFYKYNLFLFLIVFTYVWNVWVNDIWIPNEAFYAEAVREMFENHNFLDIYYNYEPRFNKPPLTYWLVALSGAIFGLNEFAVRLPIVLLGLGSLFFTYLIGKELFNKKVGLFSVFVLAFALQFVPNTRYASPEVPLMFFFTLTMYLFLVGYRKSSFKYIFWSYVALGLAVLTKGFPYLIVIGLIVLGYIFVDVKFNLRQFLEKVKFLRLWIGLPVVFVIGFWWYVYSYLKFGDAFWSVYYQETFGRAFEKGGKPFFSIQNLTYYFIVILWAFLPYSLAFYYAFIKKIKEFISYGYNFLYVWIGVILTIFTIAKGKLPPYILQAYPAMAILTAVCMLQCIPKGVERFVYPILYILPTVIFAVATAALTYLLHLDYLYYVFAIAGIAYIFRWKDYLLAPFMAAVAFFLMFVISVLPHIEKYRPYDKIGLAIKEHVIPKKYPLIIENKFFHNLPFYAERKVLRDYPLQKILSYPKPRLALIYKKDLKYFKGAQVLWEGKLYDWGSESQFAKFLKAVIYAENGDYRGFKDWVLIFQR